MLFDKNETLRAMGLDEEVTRMENGCCPLCGCSTGAEVRSHMEQKMFLMTGLCLRCGLEVDKTADMSTEDLTAYIETEREMEQVIRGPAHV